MAKIYKLILFLSLFILLPFRVEAATLSLSPTSGTFDVGDRVTVRILVSSDLPINAISGALSFPPIFLIESVSKANSILNFWVSEPNFSEGSGSLKFEGVALGGYTKNTGTVLTIILKANKEGSGSITFKDGQILANDGQGTDLTSGFGGSSFSVKPKAITKPTATSEEELTEVTQEEIVPKPATPQEPPTLKSPEITLTKLFGEDAVSGISGYPNSQSLITFISAGGEKIFVQSDTNVNGDFRILIPQSLKRGEYTVTAVVIESDLSHSPPSNQITVKVGNIFSDISSEVKLIISLLILILLYLMIRTYTYLTRNRKIKSHLKQESKEAQSMVHKSFKLLKKDIAEMASVREIKKDLSHAEEEIIDEIKDIEKS